MKSVYTNMEEKELASLSGMAWYVAKTRYFRQEIRMRDELSRREIVSFVPTVSVKKSRGRNTYEKPIAPNIVFVRATKKDACMLVTKYCYPIYFVPDCATKQMMVVPDKQMEDFRRVFSLSIKDGGLMNKPLNGGEKVRVTKGSLKGVEGCVEELLGKTYVVVGLIGCLWARARIPRAWLETI